jgi:hypothetical protein
MKTEKLAYFKKIMESKSNEELGRIWQEKDTSKYSREALEAAHQVLIERGAVGSSPQSTPEHSGRPSSLIRCKDCGKEVSKRAEKCPNCGAPVKKTFNRPRGCFFNIILVFFILLIVGIFFERITQKPPEEPKQVRKEVKESHESKESKGPTTVTVGQTVSVGNMSYTVNKTWWSDKLSENPLLNKKPDARFLFIRLSVSNDGNKPKDIPSFKLIDSMGREHGISDKAWRVEDALGSGSLNPGVTKSGVIVFDVDEIEDYKLKITGGLLSSDYALVEVSYKWYQLEQREKKGK